MASQLPPSWASCYQQRHLHRQGSSRSIIQIFAVGRLTKTLLFLCIFLLLSFCDALSVSLSRASQASQGGRRTVAGSSFVHEVHLLQRTRAGLQVVLQLLRESRVQNQEIAGVKGAGIPGVVVSPHSPSQSSSCKAGTLELAYIYICRV